MARLSASLSLCLVLGAPAAGQCLDGAAGTTIGSGDNTVFTTHYPLGFSMPVANSALGGYSHFRVCTNGWIILTNGSTTSGSPGNTNHGSSSSLAGTTTGHAPRIAPFWKHMYVTGQVSYDTTSAPGSICRVLFTDTIEADVPTTATSKTYEVILHSTGRIDFAYSAGMDVEGDAVAYCGVSRANGEGVPAASDLSESVATLGVGCVWQSFAAGEFDLGGKTICFTPDGSGGWNTTMCCDGSTVDPFGEGSYEIPEPEALYDAWPDAATAKTALDGHRVRVSKSTRGYTPSGYTASWDPPGLTFFPPTILATPLPTTDDGWTFVVPSTPFPLADGGTCAGFAVSHNGIVTLGNYPNNAGDWTPSGAELAATNRQAIYSWHDFNDTEVGSGTIKFEEIGSLFLLTWDNVESYASPELANPSTVQFQFNLANGNMAVLWMLVDGNTTSPFGSATVVGYTGPGASPDPGPTDFAQSLPVFVPHNVQPLTLSANLAPVCTPVTGTNVTFTTKNMVELAPGSGFFFGLLIFSFGAIPPTDLGFLGAPGVTLHLASFDIVFGIAGTSRIQQTPVSFPAGTPAGLTLYAQAANLFDPAFPLPNGQNPFGVIMSNALANYVNTF